MGFILFRLFLQHRVNRDVIVGEHSCDVGQHAGLVVDTQAQVVRRFNIVHRQYGLGANFVVLEGEIRHALRHVGVNQAANIY